MSDVFNFGQVRVSDANGDPIPGALATFYIAGTNTLAPIKNAAGAALANPQTADAGGVFSQLVYADTALKVAVTTAAGAAVPGYPMDLAFRSAGTAAAASAISFTPTVALPYTNVQAAIEASAASAASGFQAFGLGVTGTNAALSDLDATGAGSGVYRFTASTTGTFPTGVVATDTGIVELWREDDGSARMFLMPDNSDRMFTRRMTASTWGAWREIIHVAQGAADGDIIYRASGAWSRLAKGAAGQVLQMNSGATAPEWASGSVMLGTSVASTSGTAIDFTGIPGWARRIVILFSGVSLNSTGQFLIQCGTSGGIVSTGYSCGSWSGSSATSATGMIVRSRDAATLHTGRITLENLTGNTWISSHTLTGLPSGDPFVGGGAVTLAAALDRVRITTTTGTDTFDAGSINISWE